MSPGKRAGAPSSNRDPRDRLFPAFPQHLAHVTLHVLTRGTGLVDLALDTGQGLRGCHPGRQLRIDPRRRLNQAVDLLDLDIDVIDTATEDPAPDHAATPATWVKNTRLRLKVYISSAAVAVEAFACLTMCTASSTRPAST